MTTLVKAFAESIALGAALALAAGCSTKPLQPGTGGGGGAGSIDAGKDTPPTTQPDAADDLPTDAPLLTGVRAFVVTSQLQRDGGVGSSPTSHVFTMIVDADRHTVIAGGTGEGATSTFETVAGGTLHVSALSFATSGCPGSSIMYDDLTFAIDAGGGLTGTGRGSISILSGDTGWSTGVTMSLTGVADMQPPMLTVSGGPLDPFFSFSVLPSEPLPAGGSLTLRAASGDTTTLAADTRTGGFVIAFPKPAVMLYYATQYQILADGIVDFAGNAASASNLGFTTNALPPLAAEDGFESVTATTFGGVAVLSGAGAPTLSGAQSLYIPPGGGLGSSGGAQPQLMVRLSLGAGDTVVRFAYRTVSTGSAGSYLGGSWMMGSEGGSIVAPGLPPDSGATTPATIGGAPVTLGPLMTATFTLPADASKEIVLERIPPSTSAACSLPPRPTAGVIIDDLRAE